MTRRPAPVATPEDVDLELVARLRVAVARLNRQLRQQAGDLTPTMQSALVTIEHHGPITLGALAAIEQVAPATVTKLVTKLVEAGLVHRTVDAEDRRVARVELSLDGAERLAESRNRRNAHLATRLQARLRPISLASRRRLRSSAFLLHDCRLIVVKPHRIERGGALERAK